jgi:hypothetical protein
MITNELLKNTRTATTAHLAKNHPAQCTFDHTSRPFLHQLHRSRSFIAPNNIIMLSNKRTLFLLAGIILLSTSCRRDRNYTCSCTARMLPSYYKEEVVSAKNKKEARSKCEALSDPATLSDGTDCELKD